MNQPFEDYIPYEQYHKAPRYDACWTLMFKPKADSIRFKPGELKAGMWKDDGTLYITD